MLCVPENIADLNSILDQVMALLFLSKFLRYISNIHLGCVIELLPAMNMANIQYQWSLVAANGKDT